MSVFLAIWMLCGVATVVIAYRKNLNIAVWFFIGILGVFGLVAAVFHPRDTSIWQAGDKTPPGSGSGGGCGGGCTVGCGGGCGGG